MFGIPLVMKGVGSFCMGNMFPVGGKGESGPRLSIEPGWALLWSRSQALGCPVLLRTIPGCPFNPAASSPLSLAWPILFPAGPDLAAATPGFYGSWPCCHSPCSWC